MLNGHFTRPWLWVLAGWALIYCATPVWSVPPDDAAQTLFQLETGENAKYGYRIPALTVSSTGTLLAFCERRLGMHDHAENDIVLRRSRDNGVSWLPLQVVREEGGDSLNDPCVVVLDSGRILLRYTRMPKGIHARVSDRTDIADAGYGGPKNIRLYLMHSDDDGKSWSEPLEVTRQMRRETAISVGSPGVGIVLTRGPHSGRILFPNYEVYHLGGGRRNSANCVSYSDDGGQTWQLSQIVAEPSGSGTGNEAQIVELTNGDILMSSRDQDGGSYRKLSTSSDGGFTWSRHRRAEDLMTPQCMAALIRYSWPDDAHGNLLLQSLPHTADSRSNGTIMISRDDGRTWLIGLTIVPGDFAYSSLARLADGQIGCLYETQDHRQTKFLRIDVARLLDQ